MKQEEDRKIDAAISLPPPPRNEAHSYYSSMPVNDLEQVKEEEEYSVDDTAEEGEEDDNDEEEKPATYEVVHRRAESPITSDVGYQVVNLRGVNPSVPDLNVNVSVNVNTPNRALISPKQRSVSTSSLSSLSSAGSVRTAKAEKRLKEKLSKEVKLMQPFICN